jgi:pimeloyl-ACP methyl ester carboxylesterase
MNKLLATVAALVIGLAIYLATRGQSFSRVDAGGPALRMLRTGRGGPTVVFEAGAGGALESWTRVQPEVSRFARTISYDRAGNGLSTKAGTPRDGTHIAAELHAALHNAHEPPPYLLVGHSLGGPYIRVFAGIYPDEVAGLVLVDPTHEELILWAKAREPQAVDGHKLRPDDEVDCAPATFAQTREHPVPAGIPVFLISGQGPREIPGFLPKALQEEVRKDREIFYPAKLKFYQVWLEQFSRGELIVTENSGHAIPLEEPELIIATVRRALEKAGREASKR